MSVDTRGAFCCIVCGGSRSTAVVEGCRDLYLGKPFIVDYHRCTGCGLVQQPPIPVDIEPFYDAYPVHQRKLRLYSRLRRALLGAYLAPEKFPRNSMLLDFGCGDGWYLEWCRESGITSVGFE